MSPVALILSIVLVLLLLGALPGVGFHGLGYAPSGVLLVLVIVLLVLALGGRI